jgi:hypothetical protein
VRHGSLDLYEMCRYVYICVFIALSTVIGCWSSCHLDIDLERSRYVFLTHRLHGNVESLGVLSYRRDEGRKGRDAIILTFRDAKISVLEFDDSTHGLRIG